MAGPTAITTMERNSRKSEIERGKTSLGLFDNSAVYMSGYNPLVVDLSAAVTI